MNKNKLVKLSIKENNEVIAEISVRADKITPRYKCDCHKNENKPICRVGSVADGIYQLLDVFNNENKNLDEIGVIAHNLMCSIFVDSDGNVSGDYDIRCEKYVGCDEWTPEA